MGGGGAERQLAYLTKALTKKGLDVHVALIYEGENLPRLLENGATVHRLSYSGHRDFRIAVRLYNLVRHLDPLAVQTWLPLMDIIGGAVCLSSGRRWVLSERSNSELGYNTSLTGYIRRVLGLRSDCIVANSLGGLDYWKKASQSHLIETRVIPNIIPLDEIDTIEPAMDLLGIELNNQKWVVYAGRLERAKNISTVIRALDFVVQKSNAKALVCGEGSLRPELAQYIRSRHLENRLILCGYVSNIISVIKRATALISLSSFEGSPNIVLEAMACRCPVVVSDIPAHREILDNASAMFVSGKNAEDAAEAVLRIVSGDTATDNRVKRARELLANRNADRIGAMYEGLYESLT
jgi:glycosyltransferase involved in cell wall biosynthesis